MPETLALGQFLRTRRQQLDPVDVGLRGSGRRRTPGLRREEVATLAGVSVDYLTRLEQGRDTNPSPAVLSALADALRLSADDRYHLKMLAVRTSSAALCAQQAALGADVPDTVTTLLDRLDPTPAFVLNGRLDVLAWNATWERLVVPIGVLDGVGANLARFVFLDPRARDAYPDFVAVADDLVSQLRASTIRWCGDQGLHALIEALRQVPDFETRLSANVVAPPRRGTTRLRHPELGELRLAHEVLLLPDVGDQRLVTWLPADDAAATAIATAAAEPVSPAQLRVVGGS